MSRELEQIVRDARRAYRDSDAAGDVLDFIEERIAALTASPQAAPEGEWRMVPVEPTEAMLNVGTGGARGLKRALWQEMVSAAPSPSQGGQVTGWRMVDGVAVFSVKANTPGVSDQEFVRYDDYTTAASPQVKDGEAVPTGWYLRTGHGDSIHFGPKPPACLMPEAWRPFYAAPAAQGEGNG
jgi:hypothetical protein